MHPDKCRLWELNTEVEWYVDSSINNYRCIKYFFPGIIEERDCNTVEYFSHEVPFPNVRLTDYLKQVAIDTILILSYSPSLQVGDSTRNALIQFATLLKRTQPIL